MVLVVTGEFVGQSEGIKETSAHNPSASMQESLAE